MKRNACQKCVFAVDDDKPHCGLRGFRNDFNVEYCSAENDTIPNGYELQEDGYFSWVEKKYPKTYEECSVINGCDNRIPLKIIGEFTKLINVRNAYWRIAGQEMGLGKPWEPDWNIRGYYAIARSYGNVIKTSNYNCDLTFVFSTEEMRDAFYENFKEEIEICKELL